MGGEDRFSEVACLFALPGLRRDLGSDQRLALRLGDRLDGFESALLGQSLQIATSPDASRVADGRSGETDAGTGDEDGADIVHVQFGIGGEKGVAQPVFEFAQQCASLVVEPDLCDRVAEVLCQDFSAAMSGATRRSTTRSCDAMSWTLRGCPPRGPVRSASRFE